MPRILMEPAATTVSPAAAQIGVSVDSVMVTRTTVLRTPVLGPRAGHVSAVAVRCRISIQTVFRCMTVDRTASVPDREMTSCSVRQARTVMDGSV